MELKEEIASLLAKQLKKFPEDIMLLLEKPKFSNLGDVAFPCFDLAREFKRSPFEIAANIASALVILPKGVSKVQAIGGYMNFYFDKTALADSVIKDILKSKKRYGSSKEGKGKKIIIDYSSPNIAKPMSIGHLRSTIIGHSLYRILSFQGYKCIGINFLGDYGTQFGKLMCAYEKWGKGFEKEMKEQPIETMLKLYVRFTEEAEKNPALDDEARLWFKKLEDKDAKALALWKKFRELSLRDFKRFYDIFGIKFDVYSGESYYSEKAKDIITETIVKKLSFESEKALIISFGKNEAPIILRKSDGTTTYSTRDLAAAIDHHKKYDFYKKLYVVATEQNAYFKHLFEALKRMDYPWFKDCVHVPFGMIYLPEGKISTRKGNVVFLEDVIGKIFQLTRKFVEKQETLSNKEKDKIAKAVGISALVYGDLSNDRTRDVKFDWNNLLRLEGDSGPYLQYTYARANGILRKEKKKVLKFHVPSRLAEDEELLISDLSEFPDIVKDSATHYSPHIIANHLLRISDHFNRFYEKCPVLTADDATKHFRIELAKAVSQVMENGMLLLGMIPLKRM